MTAAVTLSITTPPGWWDLPLDAETSERDLERLVAERTADRAEALDRQAITALLRQVARSARAAGALFASQFGVADDGIEFSASILAALHHGPAGDGLALPSDPGESDVNISEVDLPAGAATRRCSRRRIGGVETCQVQYFLPLGTDPAAGPTTLILSGSCVGTNDLEAAAGLFDTIAATTTLTADEE